jgi:uncharacterized protein (DUF1015 family)
MARAQPFRAVRYDEGAAGSLALLVAPPYDVLGPEERARYLAGSPFNVVHLTLPENDHEAAALWREWLDHGVLVRDADAACWWLEQDFVGPDGVARTRGGLVVALRVEPYSAGVILPHERTHAGPKEGRLRLLRALRAHVEPLFFLYDGVLESPGGAPLLDVELEGVRNRLWRVEGEPPPALADAQLLIADGHHRYETMQAYAEERDATGAGNADRSPEGYHYILMCLVALEDPGLTIFPTHRLVSGLDDARREALRQELERDFVIEQTTLEQLAPEPGTGLLELGYFSSSDGGPKRLTLKDQAIADAALKGHSGAYRELDTGVLEALVLKGALGLSDEDIAHFNGMFYARDTEEALEMVRSGSYDAAFLMRPTRVEQVRDLAAAGENMPPKSTFFFPKLLTGLLFNPLD